MRKTINNGFLLAAAALWSAAAVIAQGPVGQWDFDNGNLAGTIGPALDYADGPNGLTKQGTSFGTTTSFGIPNIGGAEAKVMKFPAAADPAMGFVMPVPANANGENGTLVNSYTLIFDLLFPAESSGKWRALLEADNRQLNPDAEFFVNPSNGIGISGNYSGTVQPNTWHRIAWVADRGANSIRKYIDGVLVGTQGLGPIDDRFALAPQGSALLFADDDGESALGYVNSIQLWDRALSTPEMAAIGRPSAEGIPRQIPPIPSNIERFIPSGDTASRNTPVGAVIFPGSTTIQDSSITVSLNGTAIANPTITRDGGLITVRSGPQNLTIGSKYTNVVSYTDSLAGAKSFTNVFTAVLFFEGFDDIVLGKNIDEATAGDTVWTNRPPQGWTINNTEMPGFGGEDADGDGFPDDDGITEWWGWSFANKNWWVQTAGDQRRSEFALGTGTVAIADPDEWDDRGHAQGLFNSYLVTPEIPLTSVAANTAFLKFVSSWRPEALDDGGGFGTDENGNPTNNQTAVIWVSYDGKPPVQVMKWDSIQGSPTYHDHAPNESVLLDLKNPAGAQKMQITFGLLLAANDWWWAIDNVAVSAGAAPPIITVQPAGVEVEEGKPVALSVTASGDSLSYQWYKRQGANRVAVAGATSAQLNIPAARVDDNGYYSVEIKNSVGTANSSLAKVTVIPTTTGRLVLLEENFDGLTLGPNVDEGLAGEAVWTKTPPQGWSIDDSGVPGAGTDEDGVTEWAGWSFASRTWWAQTAGDQQRSKFLKGTGTSAIADSDEWDDIGHAAGNMDTSLKTRSISLQGVKPNSVVLKYDSSWLPENPQKAAVLVSFDGGASVELIRYESDANSPNFHPDEPNETIVLRVPNPANAQNMQFTFRYFDTRNNWWWAIDNLLVIADKAAIFFEDFESLVLGPNVDEALAGTQVWTSTLPAGWTRDNDATPGLDDPAIGVREWEGWNFASRTWWAQTAGDQRRSEFVKGTGTIAIADGDEWDDKGSPASRGKMNTFLSTRPIDITGAAANSLVLKFDSSWRDEPDQKVNIRVAYDGGTPIEVLRWESVPGANFHDDAPNETVTVPLRNPAGARSMILTFGYFDAGNNWWWAIDNLEVSAQAAPGSSLTISRSGGNITINVEGGNPPFLLQRKGDLSDAAWMNLLTTPSRSITLPAGGAASFFRIQEGATTTVQGFTANLSGAAEVPAVNSPGSGFGIFSIEGTTFSYDITFRGMNGNATLAHIHGPAATTASAGVLIPSSGSFTVPSPAANAGRIRGTATITDAVKANIVAGQTYANIHSTTSGGGELRGQLTPLP